MYNEFALDFIILTFIKYEIYYNHTIRYHTQRPINQQ